MPTVIEMVDAYLEANGYDGLYADDLECACKKGELAPCSQLGETCRAGYLGKCNPDCGMGCDFHIYATKEQAEQSMTAQRGEEVEGD